MAAIDTITGADGDASRFLDRLAAPDRAPIQAGDVAVVAAHPDDETLGCGAQLRRLSGVTVIIVTDGAPRDLADAQYREFITSEAYAAARRRELSAALAVAGVPETAVHCLGIPDQGATDRLVEITGRLRKIFSMHAIRIVLTHAYEGGHPDHDAAAFCVHMAAALIRGQDRREVSVVEMPFYFTDASDLVVQRFTPNANCPEIAIRLTDSEQAAKRRMIGAHKTQQEVLTLFATDIEQFRRAPTCDFTKPPVGRSERWRKEERFGMTGERWLALAARALGALNLGTRDA